MAKKISKELEQIIIDNYNNGMSPYWMVENIDELKGKRPSVVYGILKRLGVKTKRKIVLTDEQRLSRRKFDVDDNYFEVIDTAEKAYWLGFIYADGWLLSNEDKIGITLCKEDECHLEAFKKAVKSKSPIKTYNQIGGYANGEDYVRILITSKKMKQDLIKHGVLIQKTEILEFPNLDKELYNHFIRGYFDGDGSLTYGGTLVNGNRIFNIKFVGTKEMLESIQSILGLKLKLGQRHPDRNVNNYDITINGNVQVKRIMDYLYNNSTIHLERKYNKYLELINQ